MLAPAAADKRGPKAPFPLVENAGVQPVIRKRVCLPELQREPGVTESSDSLKPPYPWGNVHVKMMEMLIVPFKSFGTSYVI